MVDLIAFTAKLAVDSTVSIALAVFKIDLFDSIYQLPVTRILVWLMGLIVVVTSNGVITSPPYLNRYDYTRTYALELAYLGLSNQELKQLRQKLLSSTVENKTKIPWLKDLYSHLHKENDYNKVINFLRSDAVLQEINTAMIEREKNGDLNNKGIIRMVKGYFDELSFIIFELHRILRKGALFFTVNDNVRYGGEVIPVDFISSHIAESFGFEVVRIDTIPQQKGNSSQQMKKFGRVPLRKSITVWKNL